MSAKIATNVINWKHSGFDVDAAVHIPAGSSKTQEVLSQYIDRPPLIMKKISIEENGGLANLNGWFQSAVLAIPVVDAPCNDRAHLLVVVGSRWLQHLAGNTASWALRALIRTTAAIWSYS